MSAQSDSTTLKYGAKLKTLRSYFWGLALSLIFTFAAFTLVTDHSLSAEALYIGLSVLAVAQLLAQVICFLRFNTTKEGQWNTMPFLFTILIVVVLVFGSLWIMYNLNFNMMH